MSGPDEDLETTEQPPDMADLLAELADLQLTVDDPEEREQLREAMETARQVETTPFGRTIRGYDPADVAEAFLGSVLFGIPMAVEGGTVDIGRYVAGAPLSLVATVIGTVGMVVAILYVADIQEVEVTQPFFGVLPRRLVGALLIPYGMAVLLLTMWGQVNWAAPWTAVCTVAVAAAPMAVGAALGDILPGS